MKIGWIGCGVMGNSMCKHLLKSHKNVFVFSRTKSSTDNLINEGAIYSSPEEIAKECDVIFTMLGYPSDVEQVFLNHNNGLLNLAKKGTLIIDHTTSSPSLAQRLHAFGTEKGIGVVDAPVSGGDVGARNGTLVIMCGGDLENFEKAKPLLNSYGKAMEHFGQAGMGQHAKMANQVSVASSIAALCETLLYAQKVGLDSQKLIDLIKHGAAQTFSLEKYGPRLLIGDHKPGFLVDHFVKDLEICLDECRKMNLSLPCLTTVYTLYKLYVAQGGGKDGAHSLIECLRFINNIKKE